ncbi:CG13299 [Drosophila busckii]|uniref:CG13299 n=1 Tax=Drosophila busckii TaxID=30019 RepID=A0A0M5J199_DROBS|nr:CG13299 [Drosophila busckii]
MKLKMCLYFFCATARPLDAFSEEDDRLNEISAEFDRKLRLPNVDRIFSSAEEQTKQIRIKIRNANKIDKAETTQSSKHAHSMITSMLSFVSSMFNFGKTMLRNE